MILPWNIYGIWFWVWAYIRWRIRFYLIPSDSIEISFTPGASTEISFTPLPGFRESFDRLMDALKKYELRKQGQRGGAA